MIVYPDPEKNSTEETKTPSERTSEKTRSSNWSYSTSAFDVDVETTSSSLTENTLSMISTPWTTESWSVRTMDENDTYEDLGSSVFTWPFSIETISSTLSIQPRSTSSCEVASPFLNSSRTTYTILNGGASVSSSNLIKPPPRQNSKSPSETFTSWTVESFTSSGLVTDSKVIKAKYPWSPSTALSGTDIYPSTIDSLTSRKGSRVTLATTATLGSRNGERGHVTPLNYIGLNHGQDGNPLLNWAVRAKRVPMGDVPKIIAAV